VNDTGIQDMMAEVEALQSVEGEAALVDRLRHDIELAGKGIGSGFTLSIKLTIPEAKSLLALIEKQARENVNIMELVKAQNAQKALDEDRIEELTKEIRIANSLCIAKTNSFDEAELIIEMKDKRIDELEAANTAHMNLSVLTAEASKGIGAKDKEITRLNAVLDRLGDETTMAGNWNMTAEWLGKEFNARIEYARNRGKKE
jgi:hypothetical protein